MLITIIIFILILGLLIFVHEFGHFIAAKRAGAKVEEFGLGLPPRIFGVKRGETIYSLNWLPIGGFCKILGEGGEKKNDPRSMASKSIGQRAKIFAAGVSMNFALAVVLLIIGYTIGLPSIIKDDQVGTVRDPKVQIVEVVKDSPAEKAGLKVGDAIIELKVKSEKLKVDEVEKFQELIKAHQGKEVILGIKRGDEELEIAAVPRENFPEGQGPLGIGLAETGIVSYPIHKAIWMGITSTINLTITIIFLFGGLLWSLISTGTGNIDVAGPVGIAVLTGQVAQMGFIYVLQFTALISINLALINIFPFPGLDGGHLLFLAIEKIKGRPVRREVLNTINNIGFILLMLLILAVTFRDFARFDVWEKLKGIF